MADNIRCRWLAQYRKAYNPIHLVRLLAEEHPYHLRLKLRLSSFFQVELVRKIKFVKEDQFIWEALTANRVSEVDGTVLVKLLQQRKHYLIGLINECDREGVQHLLREELLQLNGLIARHQQKYECQTRCGTQQNQVKTRTGTPQVSRHQSVKRHLQPTPYYNLIGGSIARLQTSLNTEATISKYRKPVPENLRSGAERSTVNNRKHKKTDDNRRANKSSHLIRQSDLSNIQSLLEQTNGFEKAGFASSKNSTKPSTCATNKRAKFMNSRVKTTTNSFGKLTTQPNSKIKPKDTQNGIMKSEGREMEDNNSFVSCFNSEAEEQQQEQLPTPTAIQSKISARGSHIRSIFNQNYVNSEPSQQSHPTEVNTATNPVPDQPQKQKQATQPDPEPQQLRLAQQVRSSRNQTSKIKKLSRDEPSLFALEALASNPSVFAKGSNFGKPKDPREKIAYMQQAPLVRLRPKALYADRNWKLRPNVKQNDVTTALQILFDKFCTFSQDSTLLSFKEVKGFLRQTLRQLKRLSPPKDAEDLQKFEKLLTEPSADSDQLPKEPRLTIEDLVGLISDLAQHNSKQLPKRQYYPLSEMVYQNQATVSGRNNGRNSQGGGGRQQANKLRQAFTQETEQLRLQRQSDNDLHQKSLDCNTHMQIINRWLKRIQARPSARRAG